MSYKIPTSVLVIGEAMSAPFPDSPEFMKMDCEIPLRSLLGPERLNDAQVWNLDAWLDEGLGFGYTFRQLEKVILDHPKYSEDYTRIGDAVSRIAPIEWEVELDHYVDKTGSGQRLRNGVLKVLAACVFGMDKALVENLLKKETKMVVLFCGLTGGTGAAALMAITPMLLRSGFTSIVPVGALTHVPSIQVRGKVGQHVVRRVEQMLKLVPNLVVFTGMASEREDGTTWHDILAMAPKLAELFSNVNKLGETHNTTPNLWMLGINRRLNMLDRWMVEVLTSVGQMTAEEAVPVLKQYLDAGYLGFGAPDGEGYSPVTVKNRELLQLQHLQALLPALLYVKHTAVVVKGERQGGILKKKQTYDVVLKGSTMIDELLAKAGVRTVGELKRNGYAGLAHYERWLIESALQYTAKQAEKYWGTSWIELARIYAGHAYGADLCFEPTEFIPDPNLSYYAYVQPRVSTYELVLRALGVLGEVDDPEAALAAQRAVEIEFARQLAQDEALREEVARRLK